MAEIDIGRSIVGAGVLDDRTPIRRDGIALDRDDAGLEIRMNGCRISSIQAGVAHCDDLTAASEFQALGRSGCVYVAHHRGGDIVRRSRHSALADEPNAMYGRKVLQLFLAGRSVAIRSD
jgi:hypothetical protein